MTKSKAIEIFNKKIRFENTVCPIREFYPAESESILQRCAKYGRYRKYGIAKRECIQCIRDFLSEDVEG